LRLNSPPQILPESLPAPAFRSEWLAPARVLSIKEVTFSSIPSFSPVLVVLVLCSLSSPFAAGRLLLLLSRYYMLQKGACALQPFPWKRSHLRSCRDGVPVAPFFRIVIDPFRSLQIAHCNQNVLHLQFSLLLTTTMPPLP